nr:sigma factor-like helix-turn-helix DNA-binding protein [Psychroflexus halocasei]
MPQACQQVLKLKMSGATYKEIASELDISIKTVESQMRIAYIRLRQDLKDIFLFLMAL